MTYDFSLDRKSTIVLGAASVALVVLVFLAGFLAGMSWQREPQMMAERPAPAIPVAAGPPESGAKAPAAAPALVVPAATAAAVEAPAASAAPAPAVAAAVPVATPAAPAPAPASAPALPTMAAASTAAVSPEQSGVRLAIQVGSFLQKANAEKLADRLKNSGYSPEILLASIGTQQWSIVRVGPYQDWDEATQIAAQLSRQQIGQAVIRPIR